jgi:hypothetical protein
MGILIKSKKYQEPKSAPRNELDIIPGKKPKGYELDREIIRNQYATRVPTERHPGTFGLPYEACLAMTRIPVIGSMVWTRVNQAADFTQPQPDPYTVGFKVKHRYKSKKPNSSDNKSIEKIRDIITRAGGGYWPGGFDGFMRTIVQDSLTYDQVNFEVIRSRDGKPWGFVPLDPRTIRRALPSDKDIEAGRVDPLRVSYIQFHRDEIVNEFDRGDLSWGIRRPRSDIRAFGYGWPEPEQLIGTITNLINAETFNAAKFNNGFSPRTILGIKSNMDSEQFAAVERQVWAMLNGVAAHGRVPILQLDPEFKEDITTVNLANDGGEMEYREWVNWLLKVVCGVYQIDPAEIGFVFGNEGQGTGLQNSSAAERVSMSREKGLRPLLRSIAYWLNEWVVYQFDDNYELEFVGFDSETEQQRNTLDQISVQNWMTVNEVRALRDMPPVEDGDIILNGTWTSERNQRLERERQEKEAAEEFNMFMDHAMQFGDAETGIQGATDVAQDMPDVAAALGGIEEDMGKKPPGGEPVQMSDRARAHMVQYLAKSKKNAQPKDSNLVASSHTK